MFPDMSASRPFHPVTLFRPAAPDLWFRFILMGVWDLPVSIDTDLILSDLQGDIADFDIENGMYSVYFPVLICSGDVNGDEQITVGDAQMAFFIVLGLYYPSQEEEAAADCNCNGIVTADDALQIFRAVLLMDTCVDPIPVSGLVTEID